MFHDDLKLVLEVRDLPLPEDFAAPVRMVGPEGIIIRLSGQPGKEIDNSHEPQGLDEPQRRVVKFPELLIPFEQQVYLPARPAGMIGQEQPEIVDRGSDHHIVKIDHHKPFAGTIKEISPVAVPVDTGETDSVKEGGDILYNA